MKEQFVAYVTRYALTSGVERVLVERDDQFPHMVSEAAPQAGCLTRHFHGRDWHRSLDKAITRAEEMRAAKLKSLKKSIKNLEALSFNRERIEGGHQ